MTPRQIGGGILAAVAVAVQVISQAMGMHFDQSAGLWLLAASAGAGVAGLTLVFWPERKRRDDAMGDNYNNFGNNFGHMGPINIGRAAFELSQDHINQVLGGLIRGRPVVVQAIGNQRAWRMGETMTRALEAAGHHVVQHNIGMLTPPPDYPVTVSNEGNATWVTIYPNA